MGFPYRWGPFPLILNLLKDYPELVSGYRNAAPQGVVFPGAAPPAAYQLALRMPGSSPVNAS